MVGIFLLQYIVFKNCVLNVFFYSVIYIKIELSMESERACENLMACIRLVRIYDISLCLELYKK